MRHILIIFLFCLTSAQAQNITITGIITDKENGEPIIGGNVVVKGTMTGATTDIDGNYSVSAPANGTLVFSYLGYKSLEMPINGRSVINITMEEDKLEFPTDHPIIAYTIPYPIRLSPTKTTNGNTLKMGRPNSVESLMQGYLTGVYFENSSTPNEAEMNIRSGNRYIDGSVRYVVDGIPDAPFNPADISSIYVTKDASSAALSGIAAPSGGVVHITTKRGYSGPRLEANAWVGTQKAHKNLPDDADGIFDKYLQSGLVQHYDLTMSKNKDNDEIAGSVVFDNVEGVIKDMRAENLTTRLKAKTQFYRWLEAGQSFFYRHSIQHTGILYKQEDTGMLNTGRYNPEETFYTSTYLSSYIDKKLQLKSILSYKKTEWEYKDMDINNTKYRHLMWDNSIQSEYDWYPHTLRLLGSFALHKKKRETDIHYHPYQDIFKDNYMTKDFLLRAAYSYEGGRRNLMASIRRSEASIDDVEMDKKYAYFPAIAATWDIAEEFFGYGLRDKIDVLKIKASWDKTGQIGTTLWDSRPPSFLFYSGETTDWMKTEQINGGLKISLINGNLFLAANYFRKKTTGIPLFNNAGYPFFNNTGEVINRGWELEARFNKSFNRDLRFVIRPNVTLYNPSVKKNENDVFSPGEYLAPDAFYGMDLDLSWKNLETNILLQGAEGAKFNDIRTREEYKTDYFGIKSLNVSYRFLIRNYRRDTNIYVYANAENLTTSISSNINKDSEYVMYPLNRMFSLGVRVTY